MDKVYDLLVKARDIFAERGGAKHVLEDDATHQVCAVGAVNMAHTGVATLPTYCSPINFDMCTWKKVLDLLDKRSAEMDHRVGCAFNSIVKFNNDYFTTKDDVLALFDKVIAEREEKIT